MTFFGFEEGAVRLTIFVAVLIVMTLAEAAFPRKKRTQTRSKRWLTNWGLVALDTLILRILVPVLAVGMAIYAAERGWGLFAIVSLPVWLEIILAIILLDVAIYAQHVASHKIPILWRVHKVHHADRDLDVTTGVRFHPVEIVLSMAYKLLCVVIIGPAAIAVLLFEVILNASAMFHHANVKLPAKWDKILRWLIITPDFHRVHHSVIRGETDSNYGSFLTVWDHVFRTYIAQPAKGHDGMSIGLSEHQGDEPSSLLWSLVLPFSGRESGGDDRIADDRTGGE